VFLDLLDDLQQLDVATRVVVVLEKPQGSAPVVVDEGLDGLRWLFGRRHPESLDRPGSICERKALRAGSATTKQNSRLQRAAKKLQRSEAELLREAIDRYLPESSLEGADLEQDPLFRLVGIGSGEPDLSERVDDILYGSAQE
jgi:hypothetical protein